VERRKRKGKGGDETRRLKFRRRLLPEIPLECDRESGRWWCKGRDVLLTVSFWMFANALAPPLRFRGQGEEVKR
jgi:hypothetical protein